MNRNLLIVPLMLATGLALADDKPDPKRVAGAAESPAQKPPDMKTLDGMSILGNQEAPKALVIVPWKSSEIGASLGISPMLDDSRQPIDKDVFMRALSYYEIRSETTRPEGARPGGRDNAAAKNDATQSAAASHRRKS